MKDFILACLMGLVLGAGLMYVYLLRIGVYAWPL